MRGDVTEFSPEIDRIRTFSNCQASLGLSLGRRSGSMIRRVRNSKKKTLSIQDKTHAHQVGLILSAFTLLPIYLLKHLLPIQISAKIRNLFIEQSRRSQPTLCGGHLMEGIQRAFDLN